MTKPTTNAIQKAVHCGDILLALCLTSSDSLLIVDGNGIIIGVSPAVETMFGIPQKTLHGQALDTIILETQQINQNWTQGIPDHLTWMTTAQRIGGNTFPVEIAISSFNYAGAEVALYLIRDLSTIRSDPASGDELDRLSPRQRQVLQLVARGFTSREIAQHLTISVKTVETHRANIMSRLGVRNVTGLVRFAVEIGLA